MTDEDRMVLKAAANSIHDESQWFYGEVKKLRDKITDEQIQKIEEDAESRGGLLHLSDICNAMKWKKGKDTPIRNRLAGLANRILISKGDYGAQYLFQILKRGLKEDVEDATDFFLSKKEGRAARKRRKREKTTGETRREIKGVMTEDEKKEARKERARIRREAKKLGITTEEYKAQHEKKKPELKDPAALPEPKTLKKKRKPKETKEKEQNNEAPKAKTVTRKPPGANRKRKKRK